MRHVFRPDSNQYPVKRSRLDPGSGWFPKGGSGINCEPLSAYEEGGLCPIIHGDILSGPDLLQQQKTSCSFKIAGKLGYGSYSTVWLGRDLGRDRYLPLKVLQHDKNTPDNSEMRILKSLERLQVSFFHANPSNGFQYLCLGIQPLGSTLSSLMDSLSRLPSNLEGITIFLRVVIGRVVDLHKKGICHGDISARNSAYGVHKDAFTPRALEKTFSGEERSYTIFLGPEDPPHPPRPPHLPEYITRIESLALLTDIEDMSKIQILDFGEAFEGISKNNVHGTTIFLAPERMEDPPKPASAKADIWSLGCVLVSGLAGFHLFARKDDRESYLGAIDSEAQLEIIDSCLASKTYLEEHPNQSWFVAQIINILVQVDPSLRDAEKAMAMIDELERDGRELDKA